MTQKVSHRPFLNGENSRQAGKSPVPVDNYATEHGVECKSRPSARAEFGKIVV